jgi:hypothetical protein
VGPKAGLNVMVKRKNTPRESNPSHPACSLVTIVGYPGSSYMRKSQNSLQNGHKIILITRNLKIRY